MEPAKKARKDTDDDIFYSDSEAEQDLNGTLAKVGKVKTAFRMGHSIGVQKAITQVMEEEEAIQGSSQGMVAISEEMAKDVAAARTQTRYAQRYTEQVLDTLELVKFVNTKLAKKIVEMERQAKHQELRWKSMMEKVKVQEHIIEELGKRIQEQSLEQPKQNRFCPTPSKRLYEIK
jgi:hypothetical protein